MRNLALVLFTLSLGYGLGFHDAERYDDNIVVRLAGMVVHYVTNGALGRAHMRRATSMPTVTLPCPGQNPYAPLADTIPDFY